MCKKETCYVNVSLWQYDLDFFILPSKTITETLNKKALKIFNMK